MQQISVSSFPNHPCFHKWAHKQSGHCVSNGGYTWTQQHKLPFTRLTWLQPPTECPDCQQHRSTLRPVLALFPRVISQQPGNRLITLDSFHHGRSSVLFSLEQKFTLDNLFSLNTMLMPKLPSMDVQNGLSTVMIFYIACLQSRNSPHSKMSVALGPCSRIHQSFSVLHHPEASGLTE